MPHIKNKASAPFDVKWKKSLPAPVDIVSVLANQTGVYAAECGYVYRLNYYTGQIQATSDLPGTGYNEVRLTATPDASLLLAGTSGYVVALEPISLNVKWRTSLPGSGYEVTSVLCISNTVYAGSKGYVYRLDLQSGLVQGMNELSGYGHEEVRLGMTLDGSTLLVGTNGHALGLNPTNLSINWDNSLRGSGYDVTSVVGGWMVAYASCGGMVYRIDQLTGKTLNVNDLVGARTFEVRMELGTYLYIGTNGYGIALRPDNLDTVYSTSLPGSGYSVTSVVASEDVAYYANNGYVFQLDLQGKVTAQNPLAGYGMAETRLALCRTGDGSGLLFAGLNGYAVAIGIVGCTAGNRASVATTNSTTTAYDKEYDELVYLKS